MKPLTYYIVDVFASAKYEGNQLAVFLDLEDSLSLSQMQQMAREINFAESTFIKAIKPNNRFVVRIFTPEHEIPFAGHPSIGTSYIIAKFLLIEPIASLTLELIHSDIEISILDPTNLDESIFFMRQAQPEFRETFAREEVAEGLGLPLGYIDPTLPIQEISTGLPYIIIPLKNRAAIDSLPLTLEAFKDFLVTRQKYRTNSATGQSTSLFFFTSETHEPDNQYNTRMRLIENNRLLEDAATGSANGCFLAYLLTYESPTIKATVEQGFQMGRKSYLYLDGNRNNGLFDINVGGRNQLVSEGIWHL